MVHCPLCATKRWIFTVLFVQKPFIANQNNLVFTNVTIEIKFVDDIILNYVQTIIVIIILTANGDFARVLCFALNLLFKTDSFTQNELRRLKQSSLV